MKKVIALTIVSSIISLGAMATNGQPSANNSTFKETSNDSKPYGTKDTQSLNNQKRQEERPTRPKESGTADRTRRSDTTTETSDDLDEVVE